GVAAGSAAPRVIGKSTDFVTPVTYAAPRALSTAMPFPQSALLPPRYVEYTSAVPSELSSVTNASWQSWLEQPGIICGAPVVVEKPPASVSPVTNAFPKPSTATPFPRSLLVPPR